MKKILIIGPIGDFGGRELMTGFIANVLSEIYHVEVCSTVAISNKTQVKEFFNGPVYGIGGLLFKKYFFIKLLAYISYFKSKKKGNLFAYCNNTFTRRFFNYKEKEAKLLKEYVKEFDGFIINAQLISEYSAFLIDEISKQGKKVIFRTTGTIKHEHIYQSLNKVDLFIHHSMANKNRLHLENHHYDIIDQCSFIEDKLLSIETNQKINKFLLLGRLVEEKGSVKIIDWFHKNSTDDELFIVGDGPLRKELVERYNKNPKIHFLGQVPSRNLDRIFNQVDCLIISSYEESGPLSGVEAMAAGKVIVSTRVGAMMERLENTLNNFWFDIHGNLEDLDAIYLQLKNSSAEEVLAISQSVRTAYLEHHANEKIRKKYSNAVNLVFN